MAAVLDEVRDDGLCYVKRLLLTKGNISTGESDYKA
jgi:hypothetical protein